MKNECLAVSQKIMNMPWFSTYPEGGDFWSYIYCYIDGLAKDEPTVDTFYDKLAKLPLPDDVSETVTEQKQDVCKSILSLNFIWSSNVQFFLEAVAHAKLEKPVISFLLELANHEQA